MKIDTDTFIKIKIFTLLEGSGMKPLDAIICLHDIELLMLKTLNDMLYNDDKESEDEDE